MWHRMRIDHMWTEICISMQIIGGNGSKQWIATRTDDPRRMTLMTLYYVWMDRWVMGCTYVNAIYMWTENKLNTMWNKCRWIADWKINLYVNTPSVYYPWFDKTAARNLVMWIFLGKVSKKECMSPFNIFKNIRKQNMNWFMKSYISHNLEGHWMQADGFRW